MPTILKVGEVVEEVVLCCGDGEDAQLNGMKLSMSVVEGCSSQVLETEVAFAAEGWSCWRG
jgi:hypothetical protein